MHYSLEEIISIKELAESSQYTRLRINTKISVPSPPYFITVWGFALLLSFITLGITISQKFPIYVPITLAFFCLYSAYAIFHYKSEFIFDRNSNILVYHTKVSFLPSRFIYVGSIDQAVALFLNSENAGYTNYLVLLLGESNIFRPQDIETSLKNMRLSGKTLTLRMLDGDYREIQVLGELISQHFSVPFYQNAEGKAYKLGSEYQLQSIERHAGCVSFVLLVLLFFLLCTVVYFCLQQF